jgi:hypothetical protein
MRPAHAGMRCIQPSTQYDTNRLRKLGQAAAGQHTTAHDSMTKLGACISVHKASRSNTAVQHALACRSVAVTTLLLL